MSHEHGERIPLTLADFDRSKGTITLVIQAVGKTTREMQQACQVGTTLHALVGPDGHSDAMPAARRRSSASAAAWASRPIYPAGARLQGKRRLRDRHPRLSEAAI